VEIVVELRSGVLSSIDRPLIVCSVNGKASDEGAISDLMYPVDSAKTELTMLMVHLYTAGACKVSKIPNWSTKIDCQFCTVRIA
jgi:hypothetical protein